MFGNEHGLQEAFLFASCKAEDAVEEEGAPAWAGAFPEKEIERLGLAARDRFPTLSIQYGCSCLSMIDRHNRRAVATGLAW